MISRFLATLLLAWMLGFAWFAVFLPTPAPLQKTDAIIVLTGGPGRIDHALTLLNGKQADRMLISGVDRNVKPHELAAEYKQPVALFECCIALGFKADDTRSNAQEVAEWVARRNYRTIRLVTSDWHMRRARYELTRTLPADVTVIEDAVRSVPDLRTLGREYHKYLLGRLGGLIGV